MKKKSYKKIMNRLYREIVNYHRELNKRIKAEAGEKKAKAEAEIYKRRFREFGKNVETVEPDNGKIVQCLKWEIEPEQFGLYLYMDKTQREDEIIRGLAKELSEGLVKSNIAQIIENLPDEPGGQLSELGIVGVKLYVVPWEQMPHRRTVEIMQYAERMGALNGDKCEECAEGFL